jgi:hypothetical protein
MIMMKNTIKNFRKRLKKKKTFLDVNQYDSAKKVC